MDYCSLLYKLLKKLDEVKYIIKTSKIKYKSILFNIMLKIIANKFSNQYYLDDSLDNMEEEGITTEQEESNIEQEGIKKEKLLTKIAEIIYRIEIRGIKRVSKEKQQV